MMMLNKSYYWKFLNNYIKESYIFLITTIVISSSFVFSPIQLFPISISSFTISFEDLYLITILLIFLTFFYFVSDLDESFAKTLLVITSSFSTSGIAFQDMQSNYLKSL